MIRNLQPKKTFKTHKEEREFLIRDKLKLKIMTLKKCLSQEKKNQRRISSNNKLRNLKV